MDGRSVDQSMSVFMPVSLSLSMGIDLYRKTLSIELSIKGQSMPMSMSFVETLCVVEESVQS